jgi:hypothetical protein
VRRRRWFVLVALVALAAIALVTWRLVREEPRTRRRATTQSRLDVAAFRAELAERVRRAKLLVSKRAASAPAEPPRSKAWDQKGKGPLPMVKTLLEEPQCWVGPTAMCDALHPIAEACAEGDARSCMALGQHLADEPPRILIASVFFYTACRIGDEEGCKRMDSIQASTVCEDDPFACSWRALKTSDPALHEEACSLGAAESCAMLAFDEKDDAKRLAYYETSCQLGHTMACDVLAQLVSPDCDESETTLCLPVDEEAEKRAKAIACEAGFTDHC